MSTEYIMNFEKFLILSFIKDGGSEGTHYEVTT